MPKLDLQLRNQYCIQFIQGDLRKLKSTYDIYKNQQSILKNKIIYVICFNSKNYNEDTKND